MKFWIIFFLTLHQTLSQDNADFSPRTRVHKCKSIFQRPATCKSLNDCQPLLNLIRKHPFIGHRILKSSLCSMNFFDVTICCPNIDDNNEDNNKNNSNNNQPEDKSSVEYLQPPQCGYSDAVHDRVVGGNPAALGAWPWIALIGYGQPSSPYVNFRCDGTLISSRHVVTAGHCIQNDLKSVRLGERNLKSKTDGANPRDILVEEAIVHPEFDEETLKNDIAILKLNKDVQFTNMIQPICLPLPNDVKNRNYVGTFPFVAGWGATYYNGSSSDVLREIQVPVVSNAQCERSYQYVRGLTVDDNVICAGYAQGDKDACQGDSGGPLMFPRNATYYLIGVVSGGYKCAEPGFPGIYTRVTSFLNFIRSNMN
ncbi:venom protease-like [Phymastichus coffea]|uniref:venom protease-like n=1 Tax=Phymastichus coffea TaxID=108790 RepID=UPI00273B17E7|nr:venom protease-like [Phymastichus coffea]